MPIQVTVDPKTGERRATWVEGQQQAKPAAAPKPQQDNSSSFVDAIPGVDTVRAIGAGAQTLINTGDLGKAYQAGQKAYLQSIEQSPNPIPRVVARGGREFLQNTLGNLPADVAGAVTGKPRAANAPDAKILGVLPALPEVKVQGPAEEAASEVVQGLLAWIPVARAVNWTAKGIAAGATAIPGVRAGVQGAQTAAAFAKGTTAGRVALKAGQIATGGAATGAVVDFAAFDANRTRLVDQVGQWVEKQTGQPWHPALVDYIRAKPGDTAIEARWKNAIESTVFIGPAVAGVLYAGGKAAKAILRAATSAKPAAEQVVDVTAQAVDDAAKATNPKQVIPDPPEKPAAPSQATPGARQATPNVKTYAQMREPRLWEKQGVETQSSIDLGATGAWDDVAKASVDDLETQLAKVAYTAPEPITPAPGQAPDMVPPSYGQVTEVDPQSIAVDPGRFQFKEAGRLTKSGASGSLAGSTGFNPNLGGIISVWKDPADGVTYVVNGHNRLRLAKESQFGKVLVRFLDANSAEEARAIGALQNIAEGQGTPWDAAKFMRDTGRGPDEMAAQGINLSGPVAEKAIPLTRLPRELFDRGVQGQLDLAKAVALGSEPLDEAIIRDVARKAGQGRWSADKIVQAMQEAKFAQTAGPEGGVLPGMEDLFKTSNFSQLLDVRVQAFRQLREEMVALTSAANTKRTGYLEKAGNVIDVEGSQQAKDAASQAVAVFNKVAGYKGPVRDLLNELADQVTARRPAKQVVEENLPRLRQAIEEEINGPRLPMAESPAEPAAARAATPEAAEPADVQLDPESQAILDELQALADQMGQSAKEAARNAQMILNEAAGLVDQQDMLQSTDVIKPGPKQLAESKRILGNALGAIPPEQREQAVRQLAGAEPPAPSFALPAELQRSAPRYGMATVKFASDLDRAAYVLANDAVKPSKAAAKFRTAVEEAGLDVAEVVAHGRKVKQAIKDAAGGGAAPREAMELSIPDQGFKSRGELESAAGGPFDFDNMYARMPEGMRRMMEKDIADIIRQVAGEETSIRFLDGFRVKQRSREWGGKGMTYNPGSYDPVGDLVNIFGMKYLVKPQERLETAFHEAFHRVQINFLTEKELKALNSFYGQMKLAVGTGPLQTTPTLIEQQARAFQRFAWARENGVDPAAYLLTGKTQMNPVVEAGFKVFDTLLDFLEKVNNVFRGRGWTSIKSIFDQAYEGNLARTRQDLGNAYAEGGAREDLINAIRRKDTIPLTRENRELFSEAELPPQPPEPPAPTPIRTDWEEPDWVQRYAQSVETNLDGLRSGAINYEDLARTNYQKLQTPMGNRIYVSRQEPLAAAYGAMQEVFPDRATRTGMESFSREAMYEMSKEWFARYGMDGEAIFNGIRPLIEGFEEYQLGALNRAMVMADKANVDAALSASQWLNAAHSGVANQQELLVQLVQKAESARRINTAIDKVTRRWGQLGAEMQQPRDFYNVPPATGAAPDAPAGAAAPAETATTGGGVPAPAAPGRPAVDLGAEIQRELAEGEQVSVQQALTDKLSTELSAASAGGELTPEAAAAADELAKTLVVMGENAPMRTKFWKAYTDYVSKGTGVPSGPFGWIQVLRTSNLISSGVTLMTNFMNGLVNMPLLTLEQSLGFAVSGQGKQATEALRMFQAFWNYKTAAMRVAGKTFKAGRPLVDMEAGTIDWLSRQAARDAQGELLEGSAKSSGWTITTMDVSEKWLESTPGRIANALWQTVGTGASRLSITADAFNGALAGQGYEHVASLARGMELAVQQGLKEGSPEAWKFANKYADERVQAMLKDVVLPTGQTFSDVAVTSPRAMNFMRAVTFTDDIVAQLEPRSLAEGMRIGESRGLKGNELQQFAQEYVQSGTKVHKIADFMLNGAMPIGRVMSLPGIGMEALASAPMVGPIFRFMQPFIRVPNNIIKSVARRTPGAQLLVDTWWRDIVSEDPGTRARAVGQLVTGGAFLSGMTMAAQMGQIRINGAGPLHPAGKEQWEIERRDPYSIQFWDAQNNRWGGSISLRTLEPYTTLFGAIGDYIDIAGAVDDETRNRLGGTLVLTLANMAAGQLLSKQYFEGFNQFYEAVFGTTNMAQLGNANTRDRFERYASRLIASMVPMSSALRETRRGVDGIARSVEASDVEGMMGFFYETLDEIKNAIPGFSKDIPPRTNWVTNQPVVLSGIWGNHMIPADMDFLVPLAQFSPWSPMKVRSAQTDPISLEMGRLASRGASFAGPRAADFGPAMRLKQSELNQYIDAFHTVKDPFGRTWREAVTELMNSEQYQSWPYDTPQRDMVPLRASAIQELISQYKDLAKLQFKAQTSKGQIIEAREQMLEGYKREKDYQRRYGGPSANRSTTPSTFVEEMNR